MGSTILLVDDQPTIVDAHRKLPEDFREIDSVLVALGEDDYWKVIHEKRKEIDVVVMDLMLDTAIPISTNKATSVEFSGFTLIKQTLKRWPSTKFIVFSQFLHQTNILHAYRMGVKCFLSKHQNSMDDIVNAISQVSDGTIVVPEVYSLTVKNSIAAYQDKHLSKFNDEELSIVEMLLNGYTTESIRDAINSTSSPATNNKISKMLKSLDCANRSELILYAVNAGLKSKEMGA